MRVLVTGGAGFIGSHAVLELLQAGHDVVVIDNLSNSSETSLERVAELAQRRPRFQQHDLLDRHALATVFDDEGPFDSVMHFAGLKAVGKSMEQPLRYYRNNLIGTLNLLSEMDRVGCRDLIFSSSCTVYGAPASLPIHERMPTGATANPYGQTKHMIEQVCFDVGRTGGWRIALLRYFNPVGAHPSGRIGEDPKGIPNNLMPFILQVAVGRRPKVSVFGNDYPTRDGTGVRDYLHVVDLAKGHLAAMDNLDRFQGARAVNLGTGTGYSVLEVIQGFAEATGKEIPYEFADRRPGDVPELYADPSLAADLIGWKAEKGLPEICADAWAWQSANPHGYQP